MWTDPLRVAAMIGRVGIHLHQILPELSPTTTLERPRPEQIS
jgi:hypothetical protein